MTEYRTLKSGDVLQKGDVYMTMHRPHLKEVDEDLYGMEIDGLTVYSYRRPIEEPSPLLDSAESVMKAVCDHIVGFDASDCHLDIAKASDTVPCTDYHCAYCPKCGEKL